MYLLMMSYTLAQWKLIDSSLTNQTLTLKENGWTFQNVEIGTCNANQEQQIVLDSEIDLIQKSIPLSVQKVQIFFDIYYDFMNSDSTQSTVTVSLIQNNGATDITTQILQIQKQGDQLQKQRRLCNSDIIDSLFEFEKIVTQKIAVSQTNFSISIQFNPRTQGNKIRIRNFQAYGFFCDSYCKTCDESNPSKCTSCFSQDSTGQCTCPLINTQNTYVGSFYQEGYGCIQECSRDHYLLDVNDICQKDPRVSSKFSFMNPYQSLSNIPELPRASLSVQTFSQYCYGQTIKKDIAGPFASQTISLAIGTIDVISFIRFRMTLYLIDFSSGSIFRIKLDNILVFYIEQVQSTLWYYGNFQDIVFKNIRQCSTLSFDQQSRFELILYPTTNSPVLQFIGLMQNSYSQWGFNDITIDIGVCQLNCKVCLDEVTCQQCNDGYFLLKSNCVNKCPIFSNDCIDYVDEIPFSQYLVKAFYDNNMTIDEIQSHFDQVDNQVGNFLTGQKFSMMQNKIVLGGLLVWNKGRYQKLYTFRDPHYAISIRFNITFGDDFNGEFVYYLDQNEQQRIQRRQQSSDQNVIGKESKESVMFVYKYYQHTLDTLYIEFECITDQDLRDGFCAISEYFIVVHNCFIGCTGCSSLEQCTEQIQIQVCSTPQYWKYDLIGNYICSDCIQNYCIQCANESQCKKCKDRFKNVHGQCICDNKEYRVIDGGECVCKSGYYEDKYSQICQGICGDKLKVEVEECDDGDLFPFDGCHQCINQCQIECSICLKGICEQCQFGYVLVLDQQQSICGDNLVDEFREDCEDGNLKPFDGCYVCNYSCDEQCEFCAKGICYKCNDYWLLYNDECVSVCGNQYVQANEQCDNGLINIQLDGCYNCQCVYGYSMIDNKCSAICGDGYTTMDEECDDANSIQNDGCHQCILECLNCNICVMGQCQQCQAGYYKDYNDICQETECGDRIKVGQEQCDDANINQFDGCYQCVCEIGWISDSSNLCSSICGDGLLVKGEQCDDANDIQFDGCYQCKLDCNAECAQCILGVCQSCNYGYNLINNNCINTCGDGILNPLKEQCDDKNNNARDGCYNCQQESGYICFHNDLVFTHCQLCQHSNCQHCQLINHVQQQCTLCQTGYFLDQYQSCSLCDKICIDCLSSSKNCINYNYNVYQIKQCDSKAGLYYDFQLRDCISLCGDGIISGSENCDDHNYQDFDGCNAQCQLEPGYLIDQDTKLIITEPNVQVQFQSSNNNKYSIVADTLQQAINCSATTLHIDHFNITNYNYTILESDLKCDLNISYFQTVEPINIIHVIIKFKTQYKKRRLQQEPIQEIIIIPQRQPYVTQEQKQQGEKMAQTSKTISQSLLFFGPLAILFGGFKFVWAILDILSWMNNFYFLNVTYPENVRQIFLQAQWDNIFQMPSLNTFNNLNDPYYFQSPPKFYEKGIDPLYFNNIQTILIFLLYVIATKIICKSIRRLLEQFYKINSLTATFQIKQSIQQDQIIYQQQQIYQIQQIDQSQQQIFQLQQIDQSQQQIDQSLYIGKQQDETNKQSKQGNKKQQKEINYLQDTRKLLYNIPPVFKSIYSNCVQFDECFIANLLKTVQLSFLDLTLAISLQLTNQQTGDYLVVKINIFLAYASILLLLFLLNFSYQISITHKKKLENKHFNDRYSCFYEELKSDERMAMSYSFINLVRKAIFIISSVVFYQAPIYQTSICFLSCALNILLLLQQNPFVSKQQYILNLIPDLGVLIVVGVSIVLAFQDSFILFDDQVIYSLGWVIGGCIYISIGLQLLFLIKEILLKFYLKVKNVIEYFRNR
ncbi:unnamed protein product [Paramecium sonneborni]|uniref:EGF-like domain-containing protein n=1 Tax=Paramecium sonneborni TaxID=65129 RepID=A0A8S1Q0E4_9CILI|nr:unnamed protein product [Paramecium sonneborni]